MKLCTQCVLPENYPGIEFDQLGVCNYCRQYKKWNYHDLSALNARLNAFRGKGKNFDCVVGISGGRDSSYALYYLVKHTDLRVTAYTADSGFVPPAAKENMARMCDILGVQLEVDNHDLLKRCSGHTLRAWLRRPTPAMIPMLCCGCKLGGMRGVLRFAQREDIPLVIMNIETPIETGQLKNQLLAVNPLARKVHHKGLALLLGIFYEILRNPAYLSPNTAAILIYEYLYFFQFERMQKLLYPAQTTMLDLFRYLEWNESTILNTITRELGWRKAENSPSTWRFDCHLSFLKNYLFMETLGITEKHDCLSAMVREGMLTRGDALIRLERENKTPANAVEEALDKINLTTDDKESFYRTIAALKAGRV